MTVSVNYEIAGGGTSSTTSTSANSGGGGDTTITEVSAVNSAGDLETFKRAGVQTTRIYDVDGVTPLYDRTFGSTLQLDWSEQLGYYVGDPATNIILPGGGVRMTVAQLWAITPSLTTAMAGFKATVVDIASIKPNGGGAVIYQPAEFVWNGYNWDYDFCIVDESEPTYNVAGGTSGNLSTLVAPKEFFQSRRQMVEVQLAATGGPALVAAGNNSARININGITSPHFISFGYAVSLTETILFDLKKTIKVTGTSAQYANGGQASGDWDGGFVSTNLLTINSLTTDMTVTFYNVQGANASLFTVRRAALRLHTKG